MRSFSIWLSPKCMIRVRFSSPLCNASSLRKKGWSTSLRPPSNSMGKSAPFRLSALAGATWIRVSVPEIPYPGSGTAGTLDPELPDPVVTAGMVSSRGSWNSASGSSLTVAVANSCSTTFSLLTSLRRRSERSMNFNRIPGETLIPCRGNMRARRTR